MKHCALLCVILLVGCATSYVAPPEGEGVELLLRDKSGLGFGTLRFGVARDCSGGMLALAPSTVKENGEVNTLVKGNEELAFNVFSYTQKGTILNKCELYASFLPVLGNRYVATFDWRPPLCFLKVEKMVGQDGKQVLVREPSFRLRRERDKSAYYSPWSTASQCLP